jgi:hypothetical protein
VPATGANANRAGEEYVSMAEVSEVMEVMKVMEAGEVVKVSEVMVWEHHGMMASPSAGHVWAATEAMHPARAVHAAHAAHHRVGRHHWRGKHRHHDSASNRYFAEHDNPPDCPAPF